jgi:hypothetical protein
VYRFWNTQAETESGKTFDQGPIISRDTATLAMLMFPVGLRESGAGVFVLKESRSPSRKGIYTHVALVPGMRT